MSKILYEKRGAVATVTLNRPEKLNAIDEEMLGALVECLEAAEADDLIRVLLLRGEGRAFSAGFDLEMGAARDGESREDYLRREISSEFDHIMRFWDFPKPIIAAVQGYCLGSSMELSAVCDITLSSEDCRFGAPEVRFGSGMVCLILPWIVGQKNAREMLLTGTDKIDAVRAREIGLVNHVIPTEQLQQTAWAMAQEIALNDPVAVQMTKKALNQSVEMTGMRNALREAMEINVEIETTDTHESREFNRILEADGPKAALAWRAAQLPAEQDST